ncbi:MAG: carbohydrate ABC transporter permease [Anaerolineae bacterium]|nr:carbohydrate ABC transporter permease [Candidatus Roseilinea sp.]MDW8449310.1 carbohydrate ABC transporter permease [Anaerolineae bacterium]
MTHTHLPVLFKLSRRTPSLLPNYVILTLLALFVAGPLIVLLFNSLKTTSEIGVNPLGPPIYIQFQNFPDAWNKGNYAVTIRNSVIVVAGTVTGVCLIAGLAAYALARLNAPGFGLFSLYLLVGTTLPITLFLVPLFFLWTRLGLTDNLFGLMVIYWATFSPFATFLLRSYMVAIPADFEDAARVDGANDWQVIRHVIIPIVWPGFLTVALVAGLGAWNEYILAYTFIQNDELKTVVTSFSAFTGRFTRDWGLTSAGAIIMTLPVIAFFLLLQRRFIEGLTQGGLKG